jgi:hypothetical protein
MTQEWEHIAGPNGRCYVCGVQDPSYPRCTPIEQWRCCCEAAKRRAEFFIVEKPLADRGEAK